MRILFLAPHPFFSERGTPIAERNLLTVLSEEGHTVDVLTYAEGDDVALPGVRVHRIAAVPGSSDVRPGLSSRKLGCDAAMLGALFTRFRRESFDLVHAVEEAVFLALALRRLRGLPYVYDMDSRLSRQVVDAVPAARVLLGGMRYAEEIAVGESLAVLAVCRTLELEARDLAPGAFVARLEDASLLAESDGGSEVDSLRSLTGGGTIALYVGNLEPVQGIDLLLDGFAAARRARSDLRLVVIGGRQDDIARYEARCRELGMGNSVHFAGPRPVDHLGAYLAQADILVSPRLRGTNTPMKVFSYLDSGRAVLATRLPTHTQVIDDSVAWLVEPDPVALAAGLVRLASDAALRERLGSAAHALVEREFSRKAYRRRVREFYREVEARVVRERGA
jgi:glycosyltransferase involved in cell wall biosynthesis